MVLVRKTLRIYWSWCFWKQGWCRFKFWLRREFSRCRCRM